jgi:4-amino-4-deoxy-L-arabinose transferase-like glycosyltransferase
MTDSALTHKLKSHVNSWTLCLIVFVIVYASFLAINLSYSSMEWDEVSHFTGGLLLSRGHLWQWITNNSFYPPAFDLVTAFYFLIGGASVFAGRFVALTFSVLALFVVYETAKIMYSAKVALVSVVFLSVMPGIVWASRMAMIETMLLFTFSTSMLFFFKWLSLNNKRDFALATLAVVIGVAVKYQMLVVAPIIMLLAVAFWKRDMVNTEVKRYLRLSWLILAVAIVAIAVFAAFEIFASGVLNSWIYVLGVGGANKAIYSARYPTPIFYLIEMVWLNNTMHPVSLILYLAGLAGISLLVYRRKLADKFLLLWFAIVYMVFTLIPNREWRYVSILFPVLAIGASVFLAQTYEKIQKIKQASTKPFTRKWGAKLATIILLAFFIGGVAYSCLDAYNFVATDTIPIPVEQAADYVALTISSNQTVLAACPVNRFNQFMVWFYLNDKMAKPRINQTLQYPEQAVDAFVPIFNVTELISLCKARNVKFVLLFEYGVTTPFFNSTLNEQQVYTILIDSGRFALQDSFGMVPNRIFVFSFA